MPNPTNKTVAVIGGGLSGLATAWQLRRAGCTVHLFEHAARTGGAVRSECTGGWVVEAGPNTMMEAGPAVSETLRDLGLESERIYAETSAKKRFIVRGGRPVPVPMAPPHLITSPLFSAGTKFRLLAEIFRRPRAQTSDISLGDLIRTHFGQELLDYAVNPLIAGIYAGDPMKLSTRFAFPKLWEIERSHGSLIRGQIAGMKERKKNGETGVPKTISFRHGLQTLTDTLAQHITAPANGTPQGVITTSATIEHLIPGRPWKVVITAIDGATTTAQFDDVVLTLPAAAMSRLVIGTLGERPLAALASMEYPPVSSLFLGFRRDQVTHPVDGFGALVPEVEKRSVLGILFSSSLFAGRAPDGHVALTIFTGGTRQPDIARLGTNELLATIAPDLRDIIGVKGEPVFVRHNIWPAAIPQYNLGYEIYADTMKAVETAHPGLFIGGNVRDGIAMSNCLAASIRLAKAITD